jgi:hypothetical protein
VRVVQRRARCRECGTVLVDSGICGCGRTRLTSSGPTQDPTFLGLGLGHEDLTLRGGIGLMVGESPPRGGLAPGETRSFDRMAEAMDLPRSEFDRVFDLVNLHDHPPKRWDPDRARRRAVLLSWQVCRQRRGLYDTVFLLGRRVADAFGVPSETPLLTSLLIPSLSVSAFVEVGAVRGHVPRAVLLPHPSGRSRWWNSPNHREDFRVLIESWLRSVGER